MAIDVFPGGRGGIRELIWTSADDGTVFVVKTFNGTRVISAEPIARMEYLYDFSSVRVQTMWKVKK